MNANKGFTLVEVMVALVIVALALPAMMINIQGQLHSTDYIRDKTIAQWVATNKLTEEQIYNHNTLQVRTRKRNGKEEMAGQEWFWNVEVKRFPQQQFAKLYGVQVEVRRNRDDESPLVSLFGIVREP